MESPKGEIVRLNLFNHLLALFHAKFACILVFSNPIFRWACCKGSKWDRVKFAQECARKQRLAAWPRGWLAAASRQTQHTCQACQKMNNHASWSTTGKNRTTGHTVISRLGLVTQSSRRPSCEPPLFWKTWRFTFSSHLSINTPYNHKW